MSRRNMPRGRINNRRTNPFAFIIIAMILFGGVDLLGGLFEFGFALIFILPALLIELALPAIILAAIIFVIVKIIQKAKGNNTTNKTSQSMTSVTTKQLLTDLSVYFNENERLYIDEGTYLVRTDFNINALSSYDIFMNDEYISNMLVFANAYPSGFNRLADEIHAIVNPPKQKFQSALKTKKKAKTEPEKPVEQPKQEEKKQTETEKGSAYFLREFKRLNDNIPNEQITSDLNQTLSYLNDINKIENEFPECKEKTTKLYQYYLPMLADILQNYHRLAENASNHEEFKTNEDRLSKTIVLINGALKTISGSLVEEYYTDLKVDMKTLESILKKDGLVDELSDIKAAASKEG